MLAFFLAVVVMMKSVSRICNKAPQHRQRCKSCTTQKMLQFTLFHPESVSTNKAYSSIALLKAAHIKTGTAAKRLYRQTAFVRDSSEKNQSFLASILPESSTPRLSATSSQSPKRSFTGPCTLFLPQPHPAQPPRSSAGVLLSGPVGPVGF